MLPAAVLGCWGSPGRPRLNPSRARCWPRRRPWQPVVAPQRAAFVRSLPLCVSTPGRGRGRFPNLRGSLGRVSWAAVVSGSGEGAPGWARGEDGGPAVPRGGWNGGWEELLGLRVAPGPVLRGARAAERWNRPFRRTSTVKADLILCFTFVPKS